MVTPRTFAQALLGALELPVTYNNVAALIAWQAAEGGHWFNTAKYNPLNTTRELPGSSIMQYQGRPVILWRDSDGTPHGVQAYQSWDQGLEATAKTLAQKNFTSIRVTLGRDADPATTLAEVKKTPWGTANLQPDQWRSYQAYGDAHKDAGEFGEYQVASMTTASSSSGVIATVKRHPWIAVAGAGLIIGVAAALAYHFRTNGPPHALRLLGAGEPRPNAAGRRSRSGGSVVQSLLFPRSKFTRGEAERWASSHGYLHKKVDVTDQYIRLRQRAPEGLVRMRTIRMGPDIKAVVGWPS